MNLLFVALYEIAWYGLWWLLFIAIAYFSARYLGWIGVIGGALMVSGIVMFLDVHWIFKDMREHPESGRDADFVFLFGMACRIVFFDILLLPVTITGLKLRARSRCIAAETKIAQPRQRTASI